MATEKTRIDFRISELLKERLKNAATEEGMSVSEYLVNLIKHDLTDRQRKDATRYGLTFGDACEIYEEWCEANDYVYLIPSEGESDYTKGIWTLRNRNGELAKVGTACCCVIETGDHCKR